MEILKVTDLVKTYGQGENMVRALDGVSFSATLETPVEVVPFPEHPLHEINEKSTAIAANAITKSIFFILCYGLSIVIYCQNAVIYEKL